MDFVLRCNALACRVELKERAAVTTCFHVYCMGCVETDSFLNPLAGHDRRCPACGVVLANPDNLVLARLNPTEDYKTSVLSGLDPDTIMECAGRALSFWHYQASHEIFYQAHIAKNMTDKYDEADRQIDRIINEAQAEINNLRSKVAVLESEQDDLRDRNGELLDKVKESSRRFQVQKQLYDKLKAQTLQQGLQTAASHSVDLTVQSIADSHRKGRTNLLGTYVPQNAQYGHDLARQYGQPYSGSHDRRHHEHTRIESMNEHDGMPPPPRPLQNTLIQPPQLESSQHRDPIGVATSHKPAPAQRSPIPRSTTFSASVNRPRNSGSSGQQIATGTNSFGLSAAAKVGRASAPSPIHFRGSFRNDQTYVHTHDKLGGYGKNFH